MRTFAAVVVAVALVALPGPAPASEPTPIAGVVQASDTAPRERIVIHGVGDIAWCNCFHDSFTRFGYDWALEDVEGIFERDDLTIGNLECAPSDLGRPLSNKTDSLRCDASALAVLAANGFEVVSMGNNHSADFGFDALMDGRSRLQSAGLAPIGAGADLAQADQAAFFTRGGWTIAVVSFSGVSGLGYRGPKTEELINPWFATDTTPGVAPASFSNMEAVVATLDPLVDLVIVSLHQGEYNETLRPTSLERRRGEALIHAGADVVIAHHHHRLLPVEYFEGRPIFWGMGNFVWARRGWEYDRTAVAEIVIEPDGSIRARLVPAHIAAHGRPDLRGTPDWSVRADRTAIR